MITRTFARRAAALALVALVPLGAAACGDDDDDATTDTTEADADETTTTEAEASGAAGAGVDQSNPDEVAVAEAWTTVFDSSVAPEQKSAYLEDPAAAAATLTAYATTGEMVQGITLEPTDVAIEGDTATVTYDILFAGTSTYQDQTGEVVNMDGTWKITTEQFCSFMATARTPCA